MSIIHDALKKVQQTTPVMPPPAVSPSNTTQAPVTAIPVKEDDKINIPLMVAAICAIVAMIFAALPYIAQKTNRPTPSAPTTTPAATHPSVKTRTPPPAQPLPTSKAMASAIIAAAIPPMPAANVPIPGTDPLINNMDDEDPFKNIQVEGVLDMAGKKTVLINGDIYEEGQTIYGRIIAEITFNSITIMDNGRKRLIPVNPKARRQ